MELSDPRALRATLRAHGVRAATSLGQRFLVDSSVLAAIVEAAEIGPDDDVLEVGPGPGVLTRALAARARRLLAQLDGVTFEHVRREQNKDADRLSNVGMDGNAV